jgi:hypothetical protein
LSSLNNMELRAMQKAEATARASETNTVFQTDDEICACARPRRVGGPAPRPKGPAHAHARQFRNNFTKFLPETVLVADPLVHRAAPVGEPTAVGRALQIGFGHRGQARRRVSKSTGHRRSRRCVIGGARAFWRFAARGGHVHSGPLAAPDRAPAQCSGLNRSYSNADGPLLRDGGRSPPPAATASDIRPRPKGSSSTTSRSTAARGPAAGRGALTITGNFDQTADGPLIARSPRTWRATLDCGQQAVRESARLSTGYAL